MSSEFHKALQEEALKNFSGLMVKVFRGALKL